MIGISALILIAICIVFRNEIAKFFSLVSVDGWMNFIGSVLSVTGAYTVAALFYKKQARNQFRSEIESSVSKLNELSHEFSELEEKIKSFKRVSDNYKAGKNKMIVRISMPEFKTNLDTIYGKLYPISQFHSFIHDELMDLLSCLEEIKNSYEMIKIALDELNYSTQGFGARKPEEYEDIEYWCEEIAEFSPELKQKANRLYGKLGLSLFN